MRKFVVNASKRSQRRNRIVASNQYRPGDIVEFDDNARGINPRICKARILRVRPGLAGHGYTDPDPVYDVESLETGRRFVIDHFQIQGISASRKIRSSRYIRSDDEVDEFDLPQVSQKYSGKKTAVNGKGGRVPAIFKYIPWKSGTLNLDYGGGDENSEAVANAFFEGKGVTSLIYDLYNQSQRHNRDVVKQIRANGGADTATLCNVLNVIAEQESRINVLKNIKNLLKPNGVLYILVHEGSGADKGSGVGRQTGEDQYQNNRKLMGYMEEIQSVFPNAERMKKSGGKVIMAPNGGSVSASTRSRRFSVKASTTRVRAAYTPEPSLEPPASREPFEVDDSQEQVEFEFDCDILLSEDSWDYADQSYDFAAGNGSRGDWYGAETGVYLGDRTSMVECLDELLESRLPSKPGMYHISGIANLIFDISGIYMYSDFQGRDEDDSPIIDETYDTDSADADFNFGASYIDRFRCEFVGEV